MIAPRTRSSHTRGDAGFTLVEVLVALALTGLCVAMFPGMLRLGTRAWEAQGELERAGDAGLALLAVEQKLAAALPLSDLDPETRRQRFGFSGDQRRLAFVAASDNGPSGAGVYRWHLEPASIQDTGLMLRVALFGAGSSAAAETRLLVRDATPVRFRYHGSQPLGDEPAQWHDAWTRVDGLPGLVEITIDSAGPQRAPRRLLVALRVGSRR
jgi:prepilin-type N-terminal cleavage/methylation domain-containing protein